MTEETGRYSIVFNGEIFNHVELRAALEKKGWRFRTKSDTEVLLRAYQEYGEDVPNHLNGQFAFAVWDGEEGKLFAARDRMGEKPFYWAVGKHGEMVFASELKSILASGLVEPRLDRVSCQAYLVLQYVPPQRTIYTGISTLRPAHACAWRHGHVREWRYWRPGYSGGEAGDEADVVEQCGSLIRQAVKRQMVADVPVGAFLSGGRDSGTIVALMSGLSTEPVRTFSVGFGSAISELPAARTMAARYGTCHSDIEMDIAVGDVLEDMATVYDEPFGDSSNIPTHLMCRFARQDVKVVLSGDGGDEVFGGYDWYPYFLSESPGKTGSASLLGLSVVKHCLRLLAKMGLPCGGRRDSAIERYARAAIGRRSSDCVDRHLSWVTVTGDRDLDTEVREAIRQSCTLPVASECMDRITDFDVNCYLPGDILVKVYRAAMANGLEVRAPFLDVDLVEFVIGLPWRLRFRNGELKYLLKRACGDLWTEPVRRGRKQGFGAPIRSWLMREDVRRHCERVLGKTSWLSESFPGCCKPAANPQHRWNALCLGLWQEKHPV